ncbi:MAG TPA: endonuclease III [Thermomicrobiales bacterium]|nr:endonuclease III [Thermomicrobiales bacterium]
MAAKSQRVDEHDRVYNDRLRLIADRLQQEYRTPAWRRHGDPLDELVSTVLSQHTSDINTARAFASLRAKLPAWDEVVSAPVETVATAIRTGGLANVKAPRIQAILRRIDAERGTFDLDDLAAMDVAGARRWLTALPGVGPKTASCVLLFSLGKAAFPVDTHVHRVTRRLGLTPPEATPESVQAAIERELGDDRDALYRLHLNLIRHGREVCRARHPRCEACILSDWCETYGRGREATAGGTTRPSETPA